MTSWRACMEPSEWMTWVDLIDPRSGDPREVSVTIESAKAGSVTGEAGKKSRKPVLRYKGWPRPHAIGATVAKTIQSIVGSDQIERWPGTRVTLYVTTTKAKSGETVNCIRVKPRRAPAGPDAEAPRDPPPAAALEQQRHEQTQHAAPMREPGDDS